MKLKPLYDKIAIIIDDKQELKSSTGLSYTKNLGTSAFTTIVGRVAAVGEGRLLTDGSIVPMKVKVGDKVLFSKMQGESYNDGKDEYTLLSEANVIAILEENEND